MNVNAKKEYKKKFTMNTKPQPLFYVPTPTFASIDIFCSLERKRTFVNRVLAHIHLFWMLRRG